MMDYEILLPIVVVFYFQQLFAEEKGKDMVCILHVLQLCLVLKYIYSSAKLY